MTARTKNVRAVIIGRKLDLLPGDVTPYRH
jgi:hypothetical protein